MPNVEYTSRSLSTTRLSSIKKKMRPKKWRSEKSGVGAVPIELPRFRDYPIP